MKIKIALIFGGVSVEHEISIITAIQAYHAFDTEKYEIVPVYIDKQGMMYTGMELLELNNYNDISKLLKECIEVSIYKNGSKCYIVPIKNKVFRRKNIEIDIAFPIMHGTNGEDGSIAGFLEIMGLPYVGPSVLGGAIGQSKKAMKQILKSNGIPLVDSICITRDNWIKNPSYAIKSVNKIGLPVIIKPSNLGSSIGVGVANNTAESEKLLHKAFALDVEVIVEKMIVDLKEINCAVLGRLDDVRISKIEEVYKSDDFLSYEDKYQSNGKTTSKAMGAVKRKIPADISKIQEDEVIRLAKETFKLLNAQGVSRIDFLIDNTSNKVYVNEINTVPGALSYYLWDGQFTFTKLLDELVKIALDVYKEKKNTLQINKVNILKNVQISNKDGSTKF